MIIANYLVEHSDLKEVWLVVTPHNPHKKRNTLAKDSDRLHLVRLAIGDNHKLRASDIEFSLPKPSYTVDTLAYLREKYTKRTFALIMGGDNLLSLPKWKNHEVILENHDIYVYNRPGYEEGNLSNNERISYIQAPLLNLSATMVRQLIRDDKSIQYLVPDAVYNYLKDSTMYRN